MADSLEEWVRRERQQIYEPSSFQYVNMSYWTFRFEIEEILIEGIIRFELLPSNSGAIIPE